MAKRIRTIRDQIRHRRIARSNPLSRIPEGVLIGRDVYHSTPSPARRAPDGVIAQGRRDLVGAA